MTSREAALYQQLDPTRPLEADETALYVNWQAEFGEDVKRRLVRSIVLSGTVPTVRLFTGHRGVGKSTELKRVQRMLQEGKEGRSIFVSYLEGERWLDLQDPTPAEIVFQIVRQLANDLRDAGFEAGEGRVKGFLREVREIRDRLGEANTLRGLGQAAAAPGGGGSRRSPRSGGGSLRGDRPRRSRRGGTG